MKSFKMNVKVFAIGIATLFASLSVLAQDLSRNRVPSVVINEFQKQFPKAADVDWELEKGVYQVEFEIDRLDHEVWFDREGRILQHKEEVKVRSLPEPVRSNARRHYRGYLIMDAEKLTRDGSSVYKLELRSLLKEIDLIVDEKGNEVVGFLWD